MAPVIGPTSSSSQEEESPAIPDAGGDEDDASVNSAVSASSITSEVGTVVDPSVANQVSVALSPLTRPLVCPMFIVGVRSVERLPRR
jgi:hypothetical protein